MWALNRCRDWSSEVRVPERLQNLYLPPRRRGRRQLNERFKPAKRCQPKVQIHRLLIFP